MFQFAKAFTFYVASFYLFLLLKYALLVSCAKSNCQDQYEGDFPLCFLLGVLWFQGGVGDYALQLCILPIWFLFPAMNIELIGRKLAESNKRQPLQVTNQQLPNPTKHFTSPYYTPISTPKLVRRP